jgi:hypothetical protein
MVIEVAHFGRLRHHCDRCKTFALREERSMRSMKRGEVKQFLCLLFVLAATPVYADPIIFQSALLGPTGQTGGGALRPDEFIGARFSISAPVMVTQIGGHMGEDGFEGVNSLFGAILRLSGPEALPTGSPFSPSEVVATTTFFVPSLPTIDFLTPLSTTLAAGDYALVFGSGQFGAAETANAFMATVDFSLPGSTYFVWHAPPLFPPPQRGSMLMGMGGLLCPHDLSWKGIRFLSPLRCSSSELC